MRVRQWDLGVVDTVYGRGDGVMARSVSALADGFAHIDPLLVDPLLVDPLLVDPLVGDPMLGHTRDLALPIGCPTSYPKPQATWCATPAPPRGDDPDSAWQRTLRWWRAAPEALLEPWAGGSVATIEDVFALRREIPQLRLCVDTGHVADVGGNIEEFLSLADHVQLRQGCVGNTQLHVDDSAGTIDFDEVLNTLDRIGYRGRLSIEYFDLPERGWGLEDPRGWALDLAHRIADNSRGFSAILGQC